MREPIAEECDECGEEFVEGLMEECEICYKTLCPDCIDSDNHECTEDSFDMDENKHIVDEERPM